MVLTSPHRGFMVPVFTPFDKKGDINLAEIPKYAKFLAEKQVKAILVNGSVGEGVLMSKKERKQVLEAWVEESKKYDFTIMVHVGGTYLRAILDLTRHAVSLNVSSLLCLPDVVFKHETINHLIDYLRAVSGVASKTPFFYYHYPNLTGVKFDMVKFLESAYHLIPTLAGIKYTHNDLDELFRCTQVHNGELTVYLGCDQLIAPALCMGVDSFILTALNYAAEEVFKIKECIEKGDNLGGRMIQKRITKLSTYVSEEMHWINGFKQTIQFVSGVKLGNTRHPLMALSEEGKKNLKKVLKEEKWL